MLDCIYELRRRPTKPPRSRLEHEALAAALRRLPEHDREVLACRFVTGLSEAETAEILGTPIGTVKSRTSRALERLQRQLAPTLTDSGEQTDD